MVLTTGMDLSRSIEDRLEFTTVDGAEDLLRESVATRPEVDKIQLRPGVVGARWRGSLAGISQLPLAHHVRLRIVGALIDGLHASRDHGALSALPDPVRFRVAASERRPQLIMTVEREFGWVNDVSDWQLNLSEDGDDWLVDLGPLHWNVRHLKLERQSFSTPTPVATVLARLSRLEPGIRVLDPFCGAATILVAAGILQPDCSVCGVDLERSALELARRNLDLARPGDPGVELLEGRAEQLPYEDGSMPRVMSNLPFGKRVGSHEGNQRLYPAFLREVSRLLPARGRAVLLTEDKRLFTDSVARSRGIKIVSERVLRYGGATPSAYVVTRSRR